MDIKNINNTLEDDENQVEVLTQSSCLFVCFVLPSSSTCDCSMAPPPPPPPLLKELEAHDQEELLQEDLRVQHGDVGGSANQGVGRVGQGMDDIIAH